MAPVHSLLRAYRSDTSGSVAIIFAIMLPVLVGAAGLGAETGYWYLSQRKLQHEADVSAHAAAIRKNAGDTNANGALTQTATYIATESGFNPAFGGLNINPNYGSNGQVEVVLTRSIPRLFSSIFSTAPMQLSARAVAGGVGGSPACLIALSTSAPQALAVTGNGNVVLNNCAAVSNSTDDEAIYVKGSGTMTAACSYTATGSYYAQKTDGLVSTSGGCSPEVGKSTATDPYVDVPEPTVSGTCFPGTDPTPGAPNGSETVDGVTYDVYRFCGGILFNNDENLPAGLYIVRGNIDKTGKPNITGTGVTFFVTSPAANPTAYGEIDLNGGNYKLSAPTTGPYSGLVFFADRDSTRTHKLNGGGALNLTGAVYVPKGGLQFLGNNSTVNCTQLIANTIEFTGTGSTNFGSSCSSAGTKTANVGATGATIVE